MTMTVREYLELTEAALREGREREARLRLACYVKSYAYDEAVQKRAMTRLRREFPRLAELVAS